VNRWELLKSLAPGFLPLVVFILADAVWGTRIGLAVAVAAGAVEFGWTYFREKVADRFILLDIGLIVFLGLVSILLENEIFFKLKPALIGVIFCVILAVSIYSPRNILLLLSKRYMKGVQIGEAQMTQFKQSLRGLLWLFCAHTVLVVYAAVFLSTTAWAFISGGLFYILFGAYFIWEIGRKRLRRMRWERRYRDDEWFDLVDESGRVMGRAPRAVCHSGPGLLHPVVHLHVVDSKDRIYLQKRAAGKQIQPGKWDTAVGGHVHSGETVEAALRREAAEELGLTDFSAQGVVRYVWETEVESELVHMFVARIDRPVRPACDEIEDGRFWRIKKIRENLGKGVFTPNFEYEYEILCRLKAAQTV